MPVSLLLKGVLLLEFVAYGLMGRAARVVFGWPYWSVIVAIPVLALVVRIALFGFEFWLSRRWGDPIPAPLRITRADLLACIAREIQAVLRSFSMAQPFPLLFAPWTFVRRPPSNRPVVLLVHGLLCNAAVWGSMRKRLIDAGFDVETVDLTPVFGPIAMTVPLLDDKIEGICKARAIDRVTVLAHSMGGLAIRAYMAAQGDARIRHVITLGTPHRGTRMAELGNTRNVREMRIGSAFLAALALKETRERRRKFTCVFSFHDNLVTPQRNAVLADAREVAFSGVGHVGLLRDADVQAQVLAELRRVGHEPMGAVTQAERAPMRAS